MLLGESYETKGNYSKCHISFTLMVSWIENFSKNYKVFPGQMQG